MRSISPKGAAGPGQARQFIKSLFMEIKVSPIECSYLISKVFSLQTISPLAFFTITPSLHSTETKDALHCTFECTFLALMSAAQVPVCGIFMILFPPFFSLSSTGGAASNQYLNFHSKLSHNTLAALLQLAPYWLFWQTAKGFGRLLAGLCIYPRTII